MSDHMNGNRECQDRTLIDDQKAQAAQTMIVSLLRFLSDVVQLNHGPKRRGIHLSEEGLDHFS
jgi:hypothetical protein